jgi:hypothetical protein
MLKKSVVSNQFSLEDYAYLAGFRPDIECDSFSPFIPLGDRLIFVGKGTTLRHPIAD